MTATPMQQSNNRVFDNIPSELKTLDQWVMWRYEDRDGRPTKVPYQAKARSRARASSTDRTTWASYGACATIYDLCDYDGIGFVFAVDGGYVGMDLDNCRNPVSGKLTEQAGEFIKRLHTYAEVSPSGKGIKLICRGALPFDKRRVDSDGRMSGGKKNERYEMYEHDRFFTITGDILARAPGTIEAPGDAIARVYWEAFPLPAPKEPANPWPTTGPSPAMPDDEVISRAKLARNSARFVALWNGDGSAYRSASEADLALCGKLAFWTQDAAQIERLVSMSSLARGKWLDRADYRRRTIDMALSEVRDTYQGALHGMKLVGVEQHEHEQEQEDSTKQEEGKCMECERLKQRVAMLELEVRALRNQHLKQAAPTLVEVVKEIDREKRRGNVDPYGQVLISYGRIAERLGVGERSVSRHVEIGADAGFFEKRVERIVKPGGKDVAGKERPPLYFNHVLVKSDLPLAEELIALASYAPPAGKERGWGGARPVCSEHPNARVVVHQYLECAECGKRLGSKIGYMADNGKTEWLEDAT